MAKGEAMCNKTIVAGAAGIIHARAHLQFTKQAIQSGKLNIGYIGGSITAFEDYRSWTEPVTNWLMNRFPDCRLSVCNSAIGATKSEFALLRVEDDLIKKECSLVFIEFVVNDAADPTRWRMRTREGLIRKLYGKCDIVLVYTFAQEMYKDMTNGTVPPSIAEFEELAEHYNLPSVWSGLSALRENMQGLLRWEEWLPDGTHPTERGSISYAKPIITYLEEEFSTRYPKHDLNHIAPMYKDNLEYAKQIRFEDLDWKSPWSLRTNRSNTGSVNPGTYLYTSAIQATLEVPFEGTGLLLIVMTGKYTGEFDYRVDDDAWQSIRPLNSRDSWMGKADWYRCISLADDLPRGQHTLQLRTKHSECAEICGTRIEINLIACW